MSYKPSQKSIKETLQLYADINGDNLKKFITQFNCTSFNEKSQEFFDVKEMNEIIDNQKQKTMSNNATKNKGKYTNEVEEAPKFKFHKFEKKGEEFEGTIVEAIDMPNKLKGEKQKVFIFEDAFGERFAMPTHAKLTYKLVNVWNDGAGKGTECLITMTGKEKTENGEAFTYSVRTA